MAFNPYDYIPQPSLGVVYEAGGDRFHPEDSARLALAAWQASRSRLDDLLPRTWGGAFICRLGFQDDLAACGRVDAVEVVPVARGRPPVVTALGSAGPA
jgi:phosphosulfolactate phosphohydrolase-like enzyme